MASHPCLNAPNGSQISRIICDTTPDQGLSDGSVPHIPQAWQPAATRTHGMIDRLAGMADPGMCPQPTPICGTSPKLPLFSFVLGRFALTFGNKWARPLSGRRWGLPRRGSPFSFSEGGEG